MSIFVVPPCFITTFPFHSLEEILPQKTKATFEQDLGPLSGVTLEEKAESKHFPKPAELPRAQPRCRSLMWWQTRSSAHWHMVAERPAGSIWEPRTPEMHFSCRIGRFTNREICCLLNDSLAQLPPQPGPWHHTPWYKSHSISVTAGLQGSFWNTRMLMHWVLFQAVSHLLGFGNLSFKPR